MNKILLSCILASSLLMAENVETKTTELMTHTELGYIQTSGNTRTETFNIDSKAKKTWKKHSANVLFDAQFSSDNDVQTKNKFLTELAYDYEFGKRFSLSYLLGYKSDKFSGFQYQYYTGPGVKYKAIATKKHNLSLEASLLYSADKYEAVAASVAYSDRYSAYRLKGLYSWQTLKNLKFNQELSIRGSLEKSNNYFVFSKSSLTSKLSSMFSAGLSYKLDYVNAPASAKENIDSTLTLNLIMDY